MNTLLILILLITVLILAIIGITVLWIRSVYYSMSDMIRNFVMPDGEKPSPMAELVERVSHTAGHAIALEVKTTIMGKASGESRLESAIASDIAQDQISQGNPLIAGLLNSFPSVKKRFLKNPELIQAVLSKLQPHLPGIDTPPKNNNHDEFASRLKGYQ